MDFGGVKNLIGYKVRFISVSSAGIFCIIFVYLESYLYYINELVGGFFFIFLGFEGFMYY